MKSKKNAAVVLMMLCGALLAVPAIPARADEISETPAEETVETTEEFQETGIDETDLQIEAAIEACNSKVVVWEKGEAAVPTLGQQIAAFARQFVGGPYVYGGASLTGGTDCSGFTMSVFRNFGISLPHSSASQRGVGAPVESLEAAQPGDIVCYSGHVGLYIGNGQIVHALNKRKGIVISEASFDRILAIRRVI